MSAHPNDSGLLPERWAYLKALRPGFGHYLHVSRGLIPVKGTDGITRLQPWPKGQGKTYNVGRNKAKRVARAFKYVRGF
jgi:hypothetical protein